MEYTILLICVLSSTVNMAFLNFVLSFSKHEDAGDFLETQSQIWLFVVGIALWPIFIVLYLYCLVIALYTIIKKAVDK